MLAIILFPRIPSKIDWTHVFFPFFQGLISAVTYRLDSCMVFPSQGPSLTPTSPPSPPWRMFTLKSVCLKKNKHLSSNSVKHNKTFDLCLTTDSGTSRWWSWPSGHHLSGQGMVGSCLWTSGSGTWEDQRGRVGCFLVLRHRLSTQLPGCDWQL